MTNAHNIFSLAVRTQAIVEHPLIRRANLGFALNQPFSWALINSAAIFVQLKPEDKHGERGDQLRVKMATLRHFNRQVGDNDISMGTINACLKPDEKDVSLEQIKEAARDRVRIERRSGKLAPANVKSRYTQLYLAMYEEACSKKRALKALMDDVYFQVNRSDEEMHKAPEGDAESGAAHQYMVTTEFSTYFVYPDELLVDMDQYSYLLDGLLDKCVQPVIRARDELQRLLDRSYRLETVSTGQALMQEIETLGKELGIHWAKLEAENAQIEAELRAAEADTIADDSALDAAFDEVDAALPTTLEDAAPTHGKRQTVKSPERIAREAEENAVTADKQQHQARMAARANKAAATRAANKAAASV